MAWGAVVRIEIVNWSRFNNPRKDVKSTTWFRFQNDFFTDPQFCDLPNDQKVVFPYLCSLASNKMKSEFEVSPMLACKILNIAEHDFLAAIDHMVVCGIIKIAACRKRTGHGTNSSRNITNITNRTNRTNELPKTRSADTCQPDHPTEADLAVGSAWFEFARSEMPWKKETETWSAKGFGCALFKLRKATGLNELGVSQVLAFIEADEFWRKNAVSPSGLLKKSERNGNRKIDNILVRMKTKTDQLAKTITDWAET